MDSQTGHAGGIKTPLMPTQEQEEHPIIPSIRADANSITIQFGETTPPEDQIHQDHQSQSPIHAHPPNVEIKLPRRLDVQEQSSPYNPEEVVASVAETGRGPSKQTHLMAMGVQKTLSKTSILVNFLPTGTLLAFEMLLPPVSGNGKCNDVNTALIGSILALCAISCCFFHFTDSVREGQIIRYGFVTFKGLMVFRAGVGVDFINEPRLKAGVTDFIHAVMSSMVFVAIAFSDHRVTKCLFPNHEDDLNEIMQSFPIMVGIVCSGLFLIFPNTRYGIGCMPA